jgi:hypothetical protein
MPPAEIYMNDLVDPTHLVARPRWPLDQTKRPLIGHGKKGCQSMKISVLGSGAFGTALAISLTTGENSITLWGRNPKQGHCVFTGPRKQRPFAELSISNVVMCHI